MKRNAIKWAEERKRSIGETCHPIVEHDLLIPLLDRVSDDRRVARGLRELGLVEASDDVVTEMVGHVRRALEVGERVVSALESAERARERGDDGEAMRSLAEAWRLERDWPGPSWTRSTFDKFDRNLFGWHLWCKGATPDSVDPADSEQVWHAVVSDLIELGSDPTVESDDRSKVGTVGDPVAHDVGSVR